jgi:2-dehydropantoate 2-reductase
LNILIEGVGGVGGVIAAELIRAGVRPALVCGNPDITAAIESRGLQVATPEDSFQVETQAVTALNDLPAGKRYDAVLLIMKANRVIEAAWDSLDHLSPDGFVVTFQNGIVEDAVADVVGAEKLVSGIIGWGATMRGPGVYQRTSGGKTYLGEIDGEPRERTSELGKILQTATPVDVNRNMRGVLWSKLAINCIVTAMGGLTGLSLGRMMANRRLRTVFAAVYREVVDTAHALGIRLEKIAADPELLYVSRDASWFRRQFKDILFRIVGRKYGNVRSSMIQSLERDRPTEIDFLNGYVVQQAARVGLPVPVNAGLVAMIKQIERGERPMQLSNLEALLPLLE